MSSLQIEADRRLLNFNTYEDYLDYLVTCTDLNNLQSTLDARIVAELGYRSSGDTLSRQQFESRLEAVKNYFFPKTLPTDLLSTYVADITDPFLKELAKREKGNRNGYLATIIFIRDFTKTGFEVSGFIDYADRLCKQDWLQIFKSKKRLWPRLDDLSYYHWRNNTLTSNNSLNFKVLIDEKQGLLFECWHDRKITNVDPAIGVPGWHSIRTRVYTPRYKQVDLYDHLVRRRC